jgi:Phasin protein
MAKDPQSMAKDPQLLAEFAEKAKESVDRQKSRFKAQSIPVSMFFFRRQFPPIRQMARSLAEKLKNYAEKNIAATHEFIQKLGQAKSFLDITRIQTEFVQTQVNALAEQAKNIGTAYVKTAKDAITTKMPFNPFS